MTHGVPPLVCLCRPSPSRGASLQGTLVYLQTGAGALATSKWALRTPSGAQAVVKPLAGAQLPSGWLKGNQVRSV